MVEGTGSYLSSRASLTASTENYLYSRNGLILWRGAAKRVPERPADPLAFPEDDERHWYDMEYAGLVDRVYSDLPSLGDGPKGKRVICLKAESDTYQRECERAMIDTAEAFGIELSIRLSGWEAGKQDAAVAETIRDKPDMIINIPGCLDHSTIWYRSMYEADIPVIATTLIPENEAFRYLVAWCGHDAWGESRMLARRFAELMGHEGSYCIVQHMPRTSAYYSRTYGVLTELKKVAPQMKLLAAETSHLRADETDAIVTHWLRCFGRDLKGIVSANDIDVLVGVNRAVARAGRDDVVRVSNGTTRAGLKSLKAGRVHALTFKSPPLDGALPIQIAADWFNGLVVERVTHLPTHIITLEDVDEFLSRREDFHNVDLEPLGRAIETHREQAIDAFFDSIYLRFAYAKVISLDLVRGFTIQLVSYMLQVMYSNGIDSEAVVGSHGALFRGLFHQPSLEATIKWMRRIAKRIVVELRNKSKLPVIRRVIQYIETHYTAPISLKTLSIKFGLSARYLGRLFRDETGEGFNDFLNKIRTARAATFLRNSSLSARDIGFEIGYGSPEYFYKTFARYMGCTPTEYRAKCT